MENYGISYKYLFGRTVTYINIRFFTSYNIHIRQTPQWIDTGSYYINEETVTILYPSYLLRSSYSESYDYSIIRDDLELTIIIDTVLL